MSTTELTKMQADLAIKPAINSLAQSSMFWRPDYLRPSPWLEHVPFLFWLVEALQPRMAVTLGMETGVAHLALCQAVQRLRLGTRCYATCREQGETGSPWRGEARAYHDAQFDSFSYLLETTSARAASQFEAGSVDLLLLNPTAEEDLEGLLVRWRPKLSSRGLVLVPGISKRDPGCEIFRDFEVLEQQFSTFAFHHGDGLGAISVGTELGPLLNNLFDREESSSAQQVVRDVFARLGRTCKDALQAREYLQKAEALEADLAEQKVELDQLSADYESARTELESKRQELAGFGQRMEQAVEQHARERGQLAERVSLLQAFRDDLKSESGQLRQRLDEQYRQVDERNQQLLQLQATHAEHLQELAKFQGRAEYSASELARAQDEQQRLQALCEHQRAEGASLSARLGELEQQLAARDRALEQLQQGQTREAEQEQSRVEEINALEERLRSLEAELAGERDSLGEKHEELIVLTELLEEAEQTQSELRATLGKREEALATQKILNDVLKSELTEKEQQRHQAQSRAGDLERRLADLEHKAENAERTNRELEELLRAKEEALAGSQASLEERYRELAALTELLEETGQKKADRETQERERARESAARIQQLESTVTDLERQLQERDSSRALIAESRDSQADTIDRLRADLAERDAGWREARKRVEQLERALESAEGQLQQVRQHNQESDRARAELVSRCEALEKRLESAEQERESLKQDRQYLQRRIQVLESNLADAKDSVDERFRELALLTRMLEDRESETRSLRMEMGLDVDENVEGGKPSARKHGLPVSVPFGKRARKLRKQRKELDLIEQSGLFDAAWYLRTYPDVAEDKSTASNPALHYLKFGAFEGRNPGPGFDSQWYLDTNPDVKDSDFNPLVHYVSLGREEGRLPLPY